MAYKNISQPLSGGGVRVSSVWVPGTYGQDSMEVGTPSWYAAQQAKYDRDLAEVEAYDKVYRQSLKSTAPAAGGTITPPVPGVGTPPPVGTVPATGAITPPNGQPGSSVSSAFNLNPSPNSGVGAFGAVPGQLGLPNPYEDLMKTLDRSQTSTLGKLNRGATNVLENNFAGKLSPSSQAAIQDAAARFGVSNGMAGTNATPGSLAFNRGLRDIGRTSEDSQRWAVGAYPGFLNTVSNTQTVNPSLQNEIAGQNALNAAAPDPTLAANASKALFDQYLGMLAMNQGGPSGGTIPSEGGAGPQGGTTNRTVPITAQPPPSAGGPPFRIPLTLPRSNPQSSAPNQAAIDAYMAAQRSASQRGQIQNLPNSNQGSGYFNPSGDYVGGGVTDVGSNQYNPYTPTDPSMVNNWNNTGYTGKNTDLSNPWSTNPEDNWFQPLPPAPIPTPITNTSVGTDRRGNANLDPNMLAAINSWINVGNQPNMTNNWGGAPYGGTDPYAWLNPEQPNMINNWLQP